MKSEDVMNAEAAAEEQPVKTLRGVQLQFPFVDHAPEQLELPFTDDTGTEQSRGSR